MDGFGSCPARKSPSVTGSGSGPRPNANRWIFRENYRDPQEGGYPPGLPEGEGRLFIDLVDALSGVIAAQSITTWPPPFTAAVRAAIIAQLQGAQDDAAAQRELDDLYRRYPTTAKLVRERASATCVGQIPTAGTGS